MFLDVYGLYTANPHIKVSTGTIEVINKSLVLPYTYITKNLITDHKNINGEWVKCIGQGKEIKRTQSYRIWDNMQQRCKPGGSIQRYIRAYVGCEASENFSSFQYFAGWCQIQPGYGLDGFALDKDLLVKGNKIYSETTCCFIPQEINSLLVKQKAIRGLYPIGVSGVGNKFVAACSNNSKRVHLGTFDSPLDAFNAYKCYKEQLLREKALQYKDLIDPRAFDALMNYEIEILD